MSIPLERPAPTGDVFDVRSHVGQLLVIEPLSLERQVPTVNGPADAIKANVYVISPQATVAEEFHGALLWQKLLVSRLQQQLGRKVLGVLTGQPGVTRDGKSVPYDLDDPSDPMFTAASRAMAAHAMTAPAAQPADPWAAQQAPAGWPGAAPQPQPAQPQQGPWQQPAQQPQQGPWGQQQLPQHPVTGQSPWNTPAPQQPAGPDERPPWETDQPSAPWGQQ